MDKGGVMLCISVDPRKIERSLSFEALSNYMLELRLDLLARSDPLPPISSLKAPTILTYRTISQGGKGDDLRWGLDLLRSFPWEKGYFLDVEFPWPRWVKETFLPFWEERVILSMHILDHTPSLDELKSLFITMADTHPRLVKIVTYANCVEDNLTIKRLLRWASQKETKLISFTMGPLGLISRVMCINWGSYMTYACQSGAPLAEGQISLHTLLEFWEEDHG